MPIKSLIFLHLPHCSKSNHVIIKFHMALDGRSLKKPQFLPETNVFFQQNHMLAIANQMAGISKTEGICSSYKRYKLYATTTVSRKDLLLFNKIPLTVCVPGIWHNLRTTCGPRFIGNPTYFCSKRAHSEKPI